MLIIENLKKSYDGVEAVKDISFTVGVGDIYGFLGPNGAGKTTTIRMIMGIIRPDEGLITLDGNDIDTYNRQNLGYLPEDRGLYQKQRIKPIEGRVVIFPGSFTHLHRGNPPLNTKYIATGWLATNTIGAMNCIM